MNILALFDDKLHLWKPGNGDNLKLSMSIPETERAESFLKIKLSAEKKFVISLCNLSKNFLLNIEEWIIAVIKYL